MGGAPRGHAAPPRLRAVARERAGRRPPGRHRRPAAARRRPGGRAHVRAGAVLAGAPATPRRPAPPRSSSPSPRPGSSASSASRSRRTPRRCACSRSSGCARSATAEYWGKRWAKYEVAAADWRAERAAAPPPLVTERLELRRFTAADLEPLLDVFGDAEVMRYVGAERRPLDRDAGRGPAGRAEAHWSAHGFGLLAVVERDDRAPGRGGRPADAGGRPGRRARLHAGARRLGSRLRDRGGAGRPALGLRRPAPAPHRRRRRPGERRLAARAREARHDAAGHARLLRRAHGRVRAVARRVAGRSPDRRRRAG